MIENRGGETEGFALKKFFRVLALFSLVTSTVVSIPNSPVANAAVAYEKLIADESTPDGLYSNRRAEVSVW